jgi:predicted transcriptional regulator
MEVVQTRGILQERKRKNRKSLEIGLKVLQSVMYRNMNGEYPTACRIKNDVGINYTGLNKRLRNFEDTGALSRVWDGYEITEKAKRFLEMVPEMEVPGLDVFGNLTQQWYKPNEVKGGASKKSIYQARIRQGYRLANGGINKIRLMYDYMRDARKNNTSVHESSAIDFVFRKIEEIKGMELTDIERSRQKGYLETVYKDLKRYQFLFKP